MPSTELLRPYVERLLAEWLQTDEIVIDGEDDVAVRHGNAVYHISLIAAEPPLLRVRLSVLRDVPRSTDLLESINDINVNILQCRMFWIPNVVALATEIAAEDLDKEAITDACNAIAKIADEFGDGLQQRFGGTRDFEGDE